MRLSMRGGFLGIFLAAFLLGGAVGAAQFDLDEGRVILRRLQYCGDCGSALLVTRVQPGMLVRCPDCGREQPRLADRYLLTQLYQMCRLCEAPLAAVGLSPGQTVECANCHTRQILSRDAFPSGEAVSGLGYVPGFPPGSGKKTLLYFPERPDGPIVPVPLEREDEALASAPPPSGPALPEIAPPVAARKTPPAAPIAPDTGSAAVTVPAVTTDLFAGAGAGAGASGKKTAPAGSDAAAGAVLARVDGTAIYGRDVERILAPVMTRLREKAGPDGAAELPAREEELRRKILDGLIDRELVFRAMEREGRRLDPAALREREAEVTRLFSLGGAEARREAERDVAMAEARRRFAADPGAIGPEAMRDYYRRHSEALRRPRLLALDQLIVYQDRAGRTDRREYGVIAGEISRELEKGTRFDEVRGRYDEFASASGLEHLEPVLSPEGAYAAGIVAAAGDLRRGAVFGPVFLDGMAVFGKVTDERPAGPAPFEEVEKEIRARLESEAAEAKLAAWLKGLRREADIRGMAK